ncbi:TlpA family protein disulfide reductase [Siphonobacter curvatus]|uniref:Thioredoxin domain-containing protein n=1 Tax=Siphonobacter curvatus TaxID=2094562 RepID=A0A2S7IPC7_9BACT|nr:TlpA disulfide reductase family protein [Siphonobacter curvatus]PQA59561.1 hypothetical protein C5O19_07930 [Siphonobacter curvatus]
MQFKSVFMLMAVLLFMSSCQDQPVHRKPVEKPAVILKDLMSFLKYRQQHVKLYETFNAVDSAQQTISRVQFLKQLATGRYLPLRLQSQDQPYYQLYPVEAKVEKDIKNTLKFWGEMEQADAQAEGKSLPDFTFVDMQGNRYTNQNTKGKIVVVKCWFLGCLPCIQEMPALNELKKMYENRKDILFVSPCWESRSKVEAFLKKTKFDYAVAPDQYNYLTDQLHLSGYPTHFVINKQGLISLRSNDYLAMAYVLNREAKQP